LSGKKKLATNYAKTEERSFRHKGHKGHKKRHLEKLFFVPFVANTFVSSFIRVIRG
jgi:hypothetical protein